VSVVPALDTTPPSRIVIVEVALFPSTAALIVAVPGATPDTIPDDETVAFAASEVLHANVRDKLWPEASLATAES
jgi:hypothetical protein